MKGEKMKYEKLDKRKEKKLPLRVERKHRTCELLKLLKDIHEILPLMNWPGRPEIIESTNKIKTILEDVKTLSAAVLKDLSTVRKLYHNATKILVKTDSSQVEFHRAMKNLEKLMDQGTDEKGYYKEKQAWKYKNHNLLDSNSRAARKLPVKT
jgi:hypothetical protein